MSRWFRLGRVSVTGSNREFEVDDDATEDEINRAASECVELDYGMIEIDGPNGKPLENKK